MQCELCEAEVAYNFLHCIPRTLHSNKWFKKRYTREQMRAGLWVCKQCHRTVHELIREKDLGRHYNTRDALLTHAGIHKYVVWKQRRLRRA